MSYKARHSGPVISDILWSGRMVHDDHAARYTESRLIAWDDLCDADPEFVEWFDSSFEQRRGDVMWKVDDHAGAPRSRVTKSGDLVVHISADDLLGHDLVPRLKELILWTLSKRAELDGHSTPPDASNVLSRARLP